jgi:hypothetical protein
MLTASPLRTVTLLALMALSLSGCFSLFHPGSVDRTIEGSYDQVFQATLETLEAQGFPFETVDREEGKIITGRRPSRIGTTGRRVEKVEAYVEDENGAADVQLFFVFADQSSEQPPRVRDEDGDGRADDVAGAAFSRSLSASAVYDDYLDTIEERVRTLRGTDGP